MYFLGDVHAKFNLIPKIPYEVIQVGDFGIGFTTKPSLPNIKYIRGNHDNPSLCDADNNYLGNYGIYNDFFFVSGAYSVDQTNRIVGVDWWEDEELRYAELESALNYHLENPRDIIVSHDAPNTIREKVFSIYHHSRTAHALQRMFDLQPPKIWVFGHHHKSIKIKIDDTTFYGLAELELLEI